MLLSNYGEAALSERTSREWFQRFKSGDFDVKDRHGGGKKKIFEDSWKSFFYNLWSQSHRVDLLPRKFLIGLFFFSFRGIRISFVQ